MVLALDAGGAEVQKFWNQLLTHWRRIERGNIPRNEETEFMKGIVFNLLEEVVTQHHGADVWDALLDAAGLEGSFTSLGNYPDEDLFKLVGAASAALKLPANDIVRWFGVQAMPLFVQKYPGLFSPHKSARSFILALNSIIHPEVKKLYPGADVPDFDFDTSSAEVLKMGYRSRRKLCAFAEGLAEGAARHFGESVQINHAQCMHRGAEACLLEMRFVPLSPS